MPSSLLENAPVSADLAFLTCTGVRANGHVVDDTSAEVVVKRAMINAAESTVLLLAPGAESSGKGAQRLCDVMDVEVLVTTAGVEPHTVELCGRTGAKVIIA
ncbi:MAG: DeoR-family protein transcriptional regulator [Streptomyces oryziradicis]|nr:DeoR-family protein transcriptional regulator [Actinacidiphila oryziradicis]